MAKVRAKAKPTREVRCYLCGHRFDVSLRTMSTTCPGCNRPIKVEDVIVKTYLPVNDLQTCGKIKITKRGRVVARLIQSGGGIEVLGTLEGKVETDGDITFGPKSAWKGACLQSRRLLLTDGVTLDGVVRVPWIREETGSLRDRR